MRNTVLFCFVLLMSSVQPLRAQEQEKSASLEWYNSFFREGKKISAEKELEQETENLAQAEGKNDQAAITKALKTMGLIHLTRTHDTEKALDLFIRSLAIEDSLGLKEQEVFTYLAIAQLFEDAGEYKKSKQFLDQAYLLNESYKDVDILVLILNELGKLNVELGQMDNAFENYEKVLEYKDEIEPTVQAEALFNLAHLYTRQSKYNEALDYHKRALTIRRSLKEKRNEAQSLNDIGELYALMKNDERAMANHTIALDIRKGLKDKKAMAESYNNIGVLYYHEKIFQRAISSLNLALDAGQEAQEQNQIRRSYEYLSFCYREQKDYKKALEFRDNFFLINDFIINERNEQQLLERQNRYVIENRESKINKLESDRIQREKEIAAQQRFNNVLFIAAGLIFIIALLILYLYVSKRKSNKELQRANAKVNLQNVALQEANATKDKFFSIISHDLKGPLNSLTSFSSLLINHSESLSQEEIKMLASDLDKSLKNLFALLENLLEWSRSQTGNIEFKAEPFDLTAVLEENKELLKGQAQNKKITLENEHKTELYVNAHRHSINTVVRNLVSNALKFTPEGGMVLIGVRESDPETTITIADTGVGMTPEVIKKLFRIDTKHSTKGTANEKGTGLGLILCKDFVEKNGGRLWVESKPGNGSVFYFTIPNTVAVEEVKRKVSSAVQKKH